MAKDANLPIPTTIRTWRQVNLNSVAATAVNNFVIATRNNIHAVYLYFASAVPAALTRAQLIVDVAQIRAWLNGEVIFDRTATEALDEYKFHFDKFGALAAPLGVIPISFMNHNLPVFDQRRGYALGMKKAGGGYNTLTVEVTMTAGVATAATGEVQVITDVYPEEVTGVHMRRLRTTRDLPGTGWMNIPNLKTEFHGLAGYHIVDGNPTRIEVSKNGEMIYRDLHVDQLAILMDQAGRTPQTGYTHIPFDLSNDLNCYEMLGLNVRDWEVKLNSAVAPGAGTVILSEEVHTSIAE